jgi:hypothetical protein
VDAHKLRPNMLPRAGRRLMSLPPLSVVLLGVSARSRPGMWALSPWPTGSLGLVGLEWPRTVLTLSSSLNCNSFLLFFYFSAK